MKARTKSILALTGTLIIGMVLGGLIASQLIRSHIRDFRELREPGGFRQHMLKTIDPSPEQDEKIQPILEAFGERMQEMHITHMKEMKSNLMMLKESLGVFLTPTQMNRLEKQLKRMRGQRGKHGRHRHHPGFILFF